MKCMKLVVLGVIKSFVSVAGAPCLLSTSMWQANLLAHKQSKLSVLGRIFRPIQQTFTVKLLLTQLSRTCPVYTKEHSLPSRNPQWRKKGVCSSTTSSAPPLPLSHKTLAEWRTLILVSYHEAICCQFTEILTIFICHCLLSQETLPFGFILCCTFGGMLEGGNCQRSSICHT